MADKFNAPTVTDRDWVEIFNALRSQLQSPTTDGDEEWRGHLANIIETIGPDGQSMIEPRDAIVSQTPGRTLTPTESIDCLNTVLMDGIDEKLSALHAEGEAVDAEWTGLRKQGAACDEHAATLLGRLRPAIGDLVGFLTKAAAHIDAMTDGLDERGDPTTIEMSCRNDECTAHRLTVTRLTTACCCDLCGESLTGAYK